MEPSWRHPFSIPKGPLKPAFTSYGRLSACERHYRELAARLNELERKYDAQFRVAFEAIRALMEPPRPPRRRIGF